jgi:hypothetical protein
MVKCRRLDLPPFDWEPGVRLCVLGRPIFPVHIGSDRTDGLRRQGRGRWVPPVTDVLA